MPKDDLLWDVDGLEREHQRLVDQFIAHLPFPRALSSSDRTITLRHVHDTPSLTSFVRDGLERFLANVGTLPDGRVICAVASPFKEKNLWLYPFIWGSKFGSCLRLGLPALKTPTQAVFTPADEIFDFLQSGRLIFVSYRLGRVDAMFEYDFTSSTEARSAFNQLIKVCITDHDAIIADDNCLVDTSLIVADSVSPAVFSKHWTRLEWLQRGWLGACANRAGAAVSVIRRRAPEIAKAVNCRALHHFELLYATLSTLNNNRLSGSSQIKEVIARFKAHPIDQLLFEGLALDRELSSFNDTDPETFAAVRGARNAAFELWNLLEVDSELSKWGRLQLSYDIFGKNSAPVVLDPKNFPIETDEDAALYWSKRPYITANRDQLLSPSDFPLALRSFVEGFSTWQVDLDEAVAEETIKQLLDEATALREWTIPPNAFVELAVGPFVGVEVTEIADDVFFVWRTAENHYWPMSVDRDQYFDGTEIFTSFDTERHVDVAKNFSKEQLSQIDQYAEFPNRPLASGGGEGPQSPIKRLRATGC